MAPVSFSIRPGCTGAPLKFKIPAMALIQLIQ
jgi:hypothetical protein